MDSKQSLSQGTAGFYSRCREAGEAVIQCLPGVAQPFDHTLGKSCHFPPKSVVLQGAVCLVLVCCAVSVEVVSGFGKEGSGHPAC